MKPLALLAGAAAILAALAITLNRPKPAAPAPDRTLPGFRPDAVAAIRVTGPDGSTEIRRGADSWTVAGRDGVPADTQKISRFLQSAWESRPVQSVPVGAAQLGRLQLAAPGSGAPPDQIGLVVEFFGESDAPLAKLTLGKRRTAEGEMGMPGMSIGRYVLADSSPATAFLVTETFDEAAPVPAPWLDKSFLTIPEVTSIERKSADPALVWTINRRDGGWVPADAKPGEVLQPARISGAAAAWQTPTFEDIGTTGETVDPDGAVTLTGVDGVARTIRRGAESNGRVPVTIESAVVLPPSRTVTPGESPEDAKRLDEEYAGKLQAAAAARDAAGKFSGRVYLVPSHLANALFLTRTDLFPPPPEPSPTPTLSPTPTPTPAKKKKVKKK